MQHVQSFVCQSTWLTNKDQQSKRDFIFFVRLLCHTQVLIKVGAAGVNPVDAYIRSGQYANLPSLPWTPGLDCAGTVEIVGHAVTKFRVGLVGFEGLVWE